MFPGQAGQNPFGSPSAQTPGSSMSGTSSTAQPPQAASPLFSRTAPWPASSAAEEQGLLAMPRRRKAPGASPLQSSPPSGFSTSSGGLFGMPPIPSSATSSTSTPSLSAPSASPFNPFQTSTAAAAASAPKSSSSPFESVFKPPPATAAGGNIFGRKEEPVAAAPGLFGIAPPTEAGQTGEGQSNLFQSRETPVAPKPLWGQSRGESVFPKAESKTQSPFSGVFRTTQQDSLSKDKPETKSDAQGQGPSIFGAAAASSSSLAGIFTKGPSSPTAAPSGLFAQKERPPVTSTAPPKNPFSSSAPPESVRPPGSSLFSAISAAPPTASSLFTRPEEKESETEQTLDREESAPPASPPPEQRVLLTAQTSTEEIRAIKTVLCDGVPPQVLNKQVLARHFSRFGNVVKLLINPRKNQATVTFDDHRSAKKAKEKGREVSPQAPPIEIIHYLKRRRSSDSLRKQPANTPQPSYSSAEVDDELAAMSGSDPFSYAAPAPAATASSSRVIGETELRSLPLKKKQDRPRREVRAGLKTEKTKRSAAAAEPEETVAKPVNERELLEIMRRPAHSDQDRYDVLEARDKLMKSRGLHRKYEGTVLVGTCPDICPERERYSRAAKNQLRVYEKLENGDVNHKAVVKEYSRSSADQDVPLPHELRPSSVLATAMAHLLANVIDRIEDDIGAGSVSVEEHYYAIESGREPERGAAPENPGEWFEFVWSTTRGLRKDITQQQLANPTAVAIVEKCARFHIVCAERLIEEDSHNFARKLNDENLTKCLQTLKHMYEDLGLEGVESPCEPEFRAYEILMNLGRKFTWFLKLHTMTNSSQLVN